MSPKESNLSPLSRILDVRGLVTSVVAAICVVVLLSLVALVVEPIRDALKAFLTAEVWVWILLLAILVEFAAFLGASFWRMRRRPWPASKRVTEVRYGGVDWPVSPYQSGAAMRYHVDPPICPSDKTQLGLASEDANVKPVPLATLGFEFSRLPRQALQFRCLKCSAMYDLTTLGYDMGSVVEIVEQHALAEERRRRLAVPCR